MQQQHHLRTKMIISEYAKFLQEHNEELLTKKTTPLKLLHTWLKKVITKNPKNHIDKIVHKETGSLRCGSMSSPINGQSSAFIFSHIENPYENYKKIKEYLEEQKSKLN